MSERGSLFSAPESVIASQLVTVVAGATDPRSGVKCGWANGGDECAVPDCRFAAWKTDERCLLVKRERGEA